MYILCTLYIVYMYMTGCPAAWDAHGVLKWGGGGWRWRGASQSRGEMMMMMRMMVVVVRMSMMIMIKISMMIMEEAAGAEEDLPCQEVWWWLWGLVVVIMVVVEIVRWKTSFKIIIIITVIMWKMNYSKYNFYLCLNPVPLGSEPWGWGGTLLWLENSRFAGGQGSTPGEPIRIIILAIFSIIIIILVIKNCIILTICFYHLSTLTNTPQRDEDKLRDYWITWITDCDLLITWIPDCLITTIWSPSRWRPQTCCTPPSSPPRPCSETASGPARYKLSLRYDICVEQVIRYDIIFVWNKSVWNKV